MMRDRQGGRKIRGEGIMDGYAAGSDESRPKGPNDAPPAFGFDRPKVPSNTFEPRLP